MLLRLFAMILLFSAVIAPIALAQPRTREDEARALQYANRQRDIARQRAQQFEVQASVAHTDAERAAAAKAAAAAKVQAAEADLAAAESRVALIEQLRADQRARLAGRQGSIIQLTAALETMARRPPALALVQPGSIRDLVHVRALFSTTLPIVRERTEELRAEVARGANLRLQADRAIAVLDDRKQGLEAGRAQLAATERASRQRAGELERSAMAEGDRVMALGEDADDIRELMGELDRQAEIRADLIELPGPRLRPARPGEATPPQRSASRDAGERPPYRLPVMGEVVAGPGRGLRGRDTLARTDHRHPARRAGHRADRRTYHLCRRFP